MTPSLRPPRIAVVGHVEHAVIASVPALPVPGSITHLDDSQWIAGGGGGIAFFQLTKSDGEIEFFTALGDDDAARAIRNRVAATGAKLHAAHREQPQTRDIVLVTPGGERTIVVVGEPLHAAIDDPLPWDALSAFDAVYFTGQDPRVLQAARAARILVVTARRSEALAKSGVRADIVIGSALDPRESSTLADYPVPPHALVMTEGARGGRIESESSVVRFAASPGPAVRLGGYGAGDSFAGALVWYLACGLSVGDACERASVHGAAVLRTVNPLDSQLRLTIPD